MSETTIQLPTLYPKQRLAFFNDARYSVCEASTKAGKTAGCIVWIMSEAMTKGQPNRSWWWVAPTYGVAKIAYRRIVNMLLRADPEKSLWDHNASEPYIRFKFNGAMIWFKGADNFDTLYGEDVFGAVIDESTRCSEHAWHAVRSTLTATRGPVRIIGNVRGRKNWAYRLGQQARSGDPDMCYSKLTAYDAVDAGVLALREVEDAKRILPPDVFKQLYLAEPASDEGNPFGIDQIDAAAHPIVDGQAAAIGIDLGKEYDFTVVVGLDAGGRPVVYQRWNQVPWSDTIERISRIADVHRNAKFQIDATGVGQPIANQLQAAYPNRFSAFKFTRESKDRLMGGLASAIHQQTIRVPDDSIMLDELRSFEYVYHEHGVRYSAPEGMHDDCVCALALAVYGFNVAAMVRPPMIVSIGFDESSGRESHFFGD